MMKELYISPEAQILCFAPAEELAKDLGIDVGSLFNVKGAMPGTKESDSDVEIPLF